MSIIYIYACTYTYPHPPSRHGFMSAQTPDRHLRTRQECARVELPAIQPGGPQVLQRAAPLLGLPPFGTAPGGGLQRLSASNEPVDGRDPALQGLQHQGLPGGAILARGAVLCGCQRDRGAGVHDVHVRDGVFLREPQGESVLDRVEAGRLGHRVGRHGGRGLPVDAGREDGHQAPQQEVPGLQLLQRGAGPRQQDIHVRQ
jgi:hypothetical protein